MKIPLDHDVSGVNTHFDLIESMNMVVRIISDTKEELDIILDNRWFQSFIENPSIIANIKRLNLQNIPIKSIIQITKFNVVSCNKLMKYSDIRHSDSLSCCIIQNEKEYFFDYFATNDIHQSDSFKSIGSSSSSNITDYAVKYGGLDEPHQFVYLTNEYFIAQQKLFFNSLWNESVSSRQKIIEIERQVIERIINPQEFVNIDESSKHVLTKIIESSVDQIIVLIPTVELFWNLYSTGLLKLFSNAIYRDVSVRILLLSEDNLGATLDSIRKSLKKLAKELEINTNFLSKEIHQEYISIIVDNAVLIELDRSVANDDISGSKVTSFPTSFTSNTNEPILASSFSTNEDKISTAATIFNSLWIQSDINRQKKIRQTYFDIFKGFKLKDEQYTRDWKFNKI
ncbi:MAG TPA: hypothetical protein VLE21_06545 [Candidatus Nitrosocosmicus sp.]|nr:hypothetical protein [Candidatus Nitrosocosmicus sp.]